MISSQARRIKRHLEHYPGHDRLHSLRREIRSVQRRSFDQYIQQLTFPGRKPRPQVQSSGVSDKTAWIALDGRERFEREKQRDLQHLMTVYREHHRFQRIAPDCIMQLPEHEAALIRRHCMDGESITAIAQAIGLSRATAYRKYDDAIEHFAKFYQDAMAREKEHAESPF